MVMRLDAYYTPAEAARRLIVKLRLKPRNVVDFCAGGGELLRMAQERFPRIECVANDKSKRAACRLRNLHPDWQVHNVDVLSKRKMRAAGFKESSYDLILYNPPFTSRGTRYSFTLDGYKFAGGKAVLFVASVLKYLSPQGVVRAILPAGVMDSERDATIVSYLRAAYGLKVICEAMDISFDGKKPNVVFVELRKKRKLLEWRCKSPPRNLLERALVRGGLSVPCAKEICFDEPLCGFIRYLHTVDIIKGKIRDLSMWVPVVSHRVVSGPCVVVPRVGKPDIHKVVIVRAGQRFVLSDCLIAIMCRSLCAAKVVRDRIQSCADEYVGIYAGTGAKFTTVKKLALFLERMQLDAKYVDCDIVAEANNYRYER